MITYKYTNGRKEIAFPHLLPSHCENISKAMGNTENTEDSEYANLTELDWVEYEFATIEYDYQIHQIAAKRIRELFKRLFERK